MLALAFCEALPGAYEDGVLVAVAGINRDPYVVDAGVGYLRHVREP